MTDMVPMRPHRPLISRLQPVSHRRLGSQRQPLPAHARAIFVANRTGIREFQSSWVLDADVILPLMSSGYEPGSTRRCAPSCQRRRLDRLARGAATQTGATAPTGGTGKRVPGS